MEVHDESFVNNIYSDKSTGQKSGITNRANKPLFKLFYWLLKKNKTKCTLLTNKHIQHILHKEFGIDIKVLHILEATIYLNVVKTFLKDWPDWDKLDENFDILKNEIKMGNNEIFDEYYTSLKQFINDALNIATPLAKKSVEEITRKSSSEESFPDILLEIEGTRDQLNHLILQHPSADSDTKMIFNVSPIDHRPIKVYTPSLHTILNWWGVNMYIYYPQEENICCLYRRESKHEFNHVLVNKKLLVKPTPLKVLDQHLQINMDNKALKVKASYVKKSLKYLCHKYSPLVQNIDALFHIICQDISLLPSEIFTTSAYKRYTNKYPYVRYLYQDVKDVTDDDRKKYDLQLQETISPLSQLYLGNMDIVYIKNINEVKKPVVVECSICEILFSSPELINELKSHFSTVHQNEIGFQCTNCDKEFAIDTLSQNWWCHKC